MDDLPKSLYHQAVCRRRERVLPARAFGASFGAAEMDLLRRRGRSDVALVRREQRDLDVVPHAVTRRRLGHEVADVDRL